MAYIKDTEKYPIDEFPQPGDIVIGTKVSTPTGKTKNFSVAGLAYSIGSLLGVGEGTGLISVDEIITNPGLAEVVNAVYRIVGVEYTYSDTLDVDPASDGFYRIDIIVGDATGLSIVQGDQSEVNPAQPATPVGYVLVGVLNINGTTIIPNVPPYNDIKLKSLEAQQPFQSTGVVNALVWGSRNTYRWGGESSLVIHSLDIPNFLDAFRYDGRMLWIVNDSPIDSNMLLKHLSNVGTGNTPIFFPDGQDLLLTKGYIVAFKLYAPTVGVNRLEFVSLSYIPETASPYKEVRFQPEDSSDTQTLPELIGATGIWLIIGETGIYNIDNIEGAGFDDETGEITLPGLWSSLYKYTIQYTK